MNEKKISKKINKFKLYKSKKNKRNKTNKRKNKSFNLIKEKDYNKNNTSINTDNSKIEFVDIISNEIMNSKNSEFINIFNFFQKKEIKYDDIQNEQIINKSNHEIENKNNSQNKSKLYYNISDLKLISLKPELVESYDINSGNPILLLQLKNTLNSIPVPKNWANKSGYLNKKRGINSSNYKLPDYVEETGISKIRDPDIVDSRILKVKAKDKVNPKIGKIEFKYKLLYEAFFLKQTKSKLTNVGEIYYEGKDFERSLKKFQPGRLTDRLKAALGMTENCIPPFILNMQRYGTPPAYPYLKIPGINCSENQSTLYLWKTPVEINYKDSIFKYNKKLNKKLFGEIIEKEEIDIINNNDENLSLND